MKFSRSHLLTIVYGVFVVLYTLYISQYRHLGWYYLEFLLISGYCFFIFQGLLLHSKNWGILLLLPLADLVASIIFGYLFLFILRLGGGTLLDADRADMVFLSLLYLVAGFFTLRYISKGKSKRKSRK